MSLSKSELANQFSSVATLLNGQPGSDGFFRAIIENVPLLFKVTAPEPPAYMFKLRTTEYRDDLPNWEENLPEEYDAANVGCDIERNYLFLWIRDSSFLNATQIAALVKSSIAGHPAFFPATSGYCYKCGRSGEGKLVQDGSDIATTCDECLRQMIADREAREKLLKQKTLPIIGLLPVTILAASLGWAVFWVLYNAVIHSSGTNRVYVPWIVQLVLISIPSLGLGWPLGRVLRRIRIFTFLPSMLLPILCAIVTVVLGEFLSASYFVFQFQGSYDFTTAVKNTLPMALGDSGPYALYKLIFAVALTVAIYHFSKKKETRLDLAPVPAPSPFVKSKTNAPETY